MTLHYVPFAYGLLLPPSNLLPNISKKIWYLIGTGFQFVQPQKSALIIKSRDYDDDLIIPAHFLPQQSVIHQRDKKNIPLEWNSFKNSEEKMHKQYTKAESAAIKIHTGQYRRSGEEYIVHPFAVAQLISEYYPNNNILYYSALFHDAIENCFDDSNHTGPKIIQAFKHIMHAIPSREETCIVISLVICLTKLPGEDYMKYVKKIYSGPLREDVLKIKIADMEHNLSSNPSLKQVQKYTLALAKIQSFFGGKPPMILSEQWKSVWNKIPPEFFTHS